MEIAICEVLGTPVAQPRPRFSRLRSGGVRAYVPEDHPVHAYRQLIAMSWKSQVGKCFDGALAVHIEVILHRPKSSKNERPIVRPDCSNYLKGIEDSLNGIAWSDDSQIVSVHIEKSYGDVEMTRIVLERLED